MMYRRLKYKLFSQFASEQHLQQQNMNLKKSSLENYMTSESLFKGPNKKLVSAYFTTQQYGVQYQNPRSVYTQIKSQKAHLNQYLPTRKQKERNIANQSEKIDASQNEGMEPILNNQNVSVNSALQNQSKSEMNVKPLQYKQKPNEGIITEQRTIIQNMMQKNKKPQTPIILVSPPLPVDEGVQQPISQQDKLTLFNNKQFKASNLQKVEKVKPLDENQKNLVYDDSPFNENNDQNIDRTQSLLMEFPNTVQNSQSQSQRNTIRMHKTESNLIPDQFPQSQDNKSSDVNEMRVEAPFFNSGLMKLQVSNRLNKKDGKNFQRMIPVSSVGSANSFMNMTPRDTILNTRQQFLNEQFIDSETFFNSTRRDTSRYIQKIRCQLKQSYKNLENIQGQIDDLIDKNLELECEKIKSSLYKAIDIQIKEFKQTERYKVTASKFAYMADLYEIKCNIDLRLQELEDSEFSLNDEYRWKVVVGGLLTPDYESTIQFILNKSDEIQEESFSYVNNFLSDYNSKMFVEIHEPLKRQMKSAIENLFFNFSKIRQKKVISPKVYNESKTNK